MKLASCQDLQMQHEPDRVLPSRERVLELAVKLTQLTMTLKQSISHVIVVISRPRVLCFQKQWLNYLIHHILNIFQCHLCDKIKLCFLIYKRFFTKQHWKL